MAKDLQKQTPEQANSCDELREVLAVRESGGIIFTTVQKFSLLDDEAEPSPPAPRSWFNWRRRWLKFLD